MYEQAAHTSISLRATSAAYTTPKHEIHLGTLVPYIDTIRQAFEIYDTMKRDLQCVVS